MYIYRFARISHVTDCAVHRVRIRITRMLKIGDGMINREAVVAAAIIFRDSFFFYIRNFRRIIYRSFLENPREIFSRKFRELEN